MRLKVIWLALLAVLLPPVGRAGEGDAAPVVLELFTSQGCSSCPPADRLLSALSSSPELVGRIVPLAFHVDYWNHIGWTDPFSSAQWSARQRNYARVLGSDRIYTPQLVVGGRTDVVGSDRRRAVQAIEGALAAPQAATVRLAHAPGGVATLTLDVVGRLAESAPEGPHRVLVALTESGLETAVGRGENGGKVLRNDHVVRRLTPAGELASPGAELATRVTLPLADGWRRDRLEAVAFVQDPRTGAILGAARPLAPAP